MELDARTQDRATLDADLCLVGAGPAALTLARELEATGARIVMLESGGRVADRDIQALCEATALGGAYGSLSASRHRQAGGTAHLWNTVVEGVPGAKYVPLDEVDFEARDWWPASGWPFTRRLLEPYYRRAHTVCGLGPYVYEATGWAPAARPPIALPPGRLTTEVYQFGPARPFTHVYLDDVRRARNVLLLHHATAVELETDPEAGSVTNVRVRTLTNQALRVRARLVVLAAGGIENARLLLLSNRARPAGLGNDCDMVGRYFMEHPRDTSARLVATAVPRGGFGLYDWHRTADGVVAGRLCFTADARRHEHLPAVAVTLLPPRRLWPRRSRFPVGPRGRRPVDVLINLEQAPDPDNRITLGSERDRLGLPRALLRWRWTDFDHGNLLRIRAILADEIARSGLGRIVGGDGDHPDPNAHHHMGTTRMHRDPRQGVVDEHARVHGVANLYVAGSSVFPTAGFANPTLTIVALALRLADHLKGRL